MVRGERRRARDGRSDARHDEPDGAASGVRGRSEHRHDPDRDGRRRSSSSACCGGVKRPRSTDGRNYNDSRPLQGARFSMKRKSYGRDAGLTLRMLATGGLLGLLYVIFAVVLFQALNVGLVPMLVIVIGLAFFQYYTSDKLALAASGAKITSREEAPELHTMVERLCAMADLQKPKIAIVPTDVPNAFATGRSPQHPAVAATQGRWRR